MDQQQINLVREFLEMCQKITKKRSMPLHKDEVYYLLENFKIKPEDKAINTEIKPFHHFNNWKNAFLNNDNLNVYAGNQYWTGFCNGYFKQNTDFIKIYLSLDHEHLYEGVRQLFSYISSENIEHLSKSTSISRTDNVIIRLRANDYKSLKKISSFIENNEYVQEGMNNINPFVPSVKNIGVMYDDGRSYNSELADLIAKFINLNNHKWIINFSNFAKFVINSKQNDKLFLNTFNQAFFEKGPYKTCIEEVLENTLSNSETIYHNNSTTKNKEDILQLAIISSFEKYDKSQAIAALTKALGGNYNYFSRIGYDEFGNEIHLREYILKELPPENLKKYVLENCDLSQVNTLEDAIRNYVDQVIYKHRGYIFENALLATAQKYSDTEQYITTRIEKYANEGKENVFTSFNFKVRENFNFRESVITKISPSKVNDIVESILSKNRIDYRFEQNQKKREYCATIIKQKISTKQY